MDGHFYPDCNILYLVSGLRETEMRKRRLEFRSPDIKLGTSRISGCFEGRLPPEGEVEGMLRQHLSSEVGEGAAAAAALVATRANDALSAGLLRRIVLTKRKLCWFSDSHSPPHGRRGCLREPICMPFHAHRAKGMLQGNHPAEPCGFGGAAGSFPSLAVG